MLKVRIIPVLLFKERTIVKSVKFADHRMIGDPTTVARVFNERNADELMFLDIVASTKGSGPNFAVIEDIANECFMPLAIGGGIRSMEDVDRLFVIGADKVCLNTALVENPSLITAIARKYGSQAVVAAIDVRRHGSGWRSYIRAGKEQTAYSALELAQEAVRLGAGEILLTSIDQDGTMLGYDIPLIRSIAEAVQVPVIASGGCGSLADCVKAVREGKANAISAASIFHFIGESIITIKEHMHEQGIPVRIL